MVKAHKGKPLTHSPNATSRFFEIRFSGDIFKQTANFGHCKKMGEGGGVESLGQKLSIMSKVSYRKYI